MNIQDIQIDSSPETFRQALIETADLIINTYKTLESRKVFMDRTPSMVRNDIDEPFPEHGCELKDLIESVAQKVIPGITWNSGPNVNAYVLSCGNQAGVLAELLAAFFNQNTGKWHLSAISAEMEQLVIGWIESFIGLPKRESGILVSGGSMANMICLAVARNHKLRSVREKGLFSKSPAVVYVSTEVHHCVVKGLELLGLGFENVRQIEVDTKLMMDTAKLEQAIEEDRARRFRPFCVVASAGTVNTGAIDDLEAIAEICKRHNLWFHVDGAYGAAAAHLEDVRPLCKGLSEADSIAVDPHKWFYVPIEAGCSLFKDARHSQAAFSHIPDYLATDKTSERMDYMEYGIQLSRGFRALKIWMTLKFIGREKLVKAIEHDIAKANYLKSLLEQEDDFEVTGTGPLSVVCFRCNPRQLELAEDDLDYLNEKITRAIEKDGRILITATKIHSRISLRACFVNHRAQQRHVDFMVDVIRELSQKCVENSLSLQ